MNNGHNYYLNLSDLTRKLLMYVNKHNIFLYDTSANVNVFDQFGLVSNSFINIYLNSFIIWH